MKTTVKADDFKFGFELELGYNDDLLYLCVEDYHEGDFEDYHYIKFESDSSIDPGVLCGEVEVITRPFKLSQFDLVMRDFKRAFMLNKYDLNEVVEINDSMGCHFHVSYKGNYNPSDYFNFAFAKSVMARINRGVKKILGENRHKRWLENVNRYYARPVKGWETDEKYSQVYIHPHYNTIEFRFFHLLGVETIEELEQMLKLAMYSTIKTFRDFSKRPHQFRTWDIIRKSSEIYTNIRIWNRHVEQNRTLTGTANMGTQDGFIYVRETHPITQEDVLTRTINDESQQTVLTVTI